MNPASNITTQSPSACHNVQSNTAQQNTHSRPSQVTSRFMGKLVNNYVKPGSGITHKPPPP